MLPNLNPEKRPSNDHTQNNGYTGGVLSHAQYRNGLRAQDRMRAGNWENTVIAADGQTVRRNACLSAHDAAMSNGSPAVIRAEVEKAIAKSGRCKLKDFNIDGKSKTDTMVCGADTIHNETMFHGGDSFETTTTHTSGGVVTVAHFKGRRTGDCKVAE